MKGSATLLMLKRLPTGWAFGQNFFAIFSFTIATGGAVSWSDAVKARPRRKGTTMVSK